MKNILLIEDEDNLNRGISLKLQKEGYTVFSAATVAEGLSLFQANTIDLVICDIGLPDGSGLDLCASIRQKSDVLFLFLTALDTEVDMITGYEMGADDYVTKPFSMSVLISKISAMLKRTEKTISNVVQTGELTFYINEKRVTKGNIELLGLGEKLNNLPNTLSGGQQQRVAIARALATKPAIVLADEPTGNLDSKTSDEVMALLKTSAMKYEQTLIVITHNEDIAQMGNRKLVIADGKVVEQ